MEKCRLCYSNTYPELSQNIFNEKLQPPIWKMIKQVSNLTMIESDPFTKIVCCECFIDLRRFSVFLEKILDTDYKIQQEKSTGTTKSDNCDYFELPIPPIQAVGDDCILKQEAIEIDEDPLKIDNNSKIEMYCQPMDNTEIIVDDQSRLSNPSELIILPDRIDNIIRINDNNISTKNTTNPIDNSDEINTSKSAKCISNDENENNTTKDVDDSKSSNKNNIEKAINKVRSKKYKKYSNENFIITNNGITIAERNQICTGGDTLFKCHICHKQFVLRNYLKAHLKTHTGERRYHCNICDKNFASKNSLLIHWRLHTGEKPYKCNICNRQFTQNYNLTLHLRIHTGEKPYHCNICDKKFPQKSSLNLHVKKHGRVGDSKENSSKMSYNNELIDNSADCNNTEENIILPDRIDNIRIYDDKTTTNNCTNLNDNSHERNESTENCTKYDENCRISTNNEPIKRIFNYNIITSDEVNKRPVKEIQDNKNKNCKGINEGRSQKYKKNGNGISTISDLHQVYYTSERRPFKCHVCHKPFAQHNYLKAHLKTHTGETRYHCNICEKNFATKNSLLIHWRLHTGERPYKCNFCNKSFTQNYDLTLHLRIHTGEKPYHCNICDKKFSQKRYLNVHCVKSHDMEK